LFQLCGKDEISFDTVAETGNNDKATFDIVARIDQLVAFDNAAWTLLLVWTGLKLTTLCCLDIVAGVDGA